MARALDDVVALSDSLAPVREGTLHASITWEWTGREGDNLRARFGSALRYAAMRELGGVIRPVRAKRLVWRDMEGRWHSAKEVVQVPGGRKGTAKHGKPYIRPAGERFGEFMDKHLKRTA